MAEKRYYVFEADSVTSFNMPEGMDKEGVIDLVSELLTDTDYDTEDVVVIQGEVVQLAVTRTVSFR